MDSYDEIMRLYDVSVNQSKENKELKNTITELKDALKFESKVVEKLLQTPKSISAGCPFGDLCICEGDGVFLGCQGSRLKWARLAVEAEMDKQ